MGKKDSLELVENVIEAPKRKSSPVDEIERAKRNLIRNLMGKNDLEIRGLGLQQRKIGFTQIYFYIPISKLSFPFHIPNYRDCKADQEKRKGK